VALTDRESRPVARQRQIGGRSHYQTEHVADEVSPEAVGDAGSGIGDPGKCRRPGGLSRRRRGILDPDEKAAGLPTAHQAVDDFDAAAGAIACHPGSTERKMKLPRRHSDCRASASPVVSGPLLPSGNT
jgi:hypothetical protein